MIFQRCARGAGALFSINITRRIGVLNLIPHITTNFMSYFDTMFYIPATVGHVFPRFISQNSQPIFMQFCKNFTIFAFPAKYRTIFIRKCCIVQKLDHLACSAIQGLCLQRDANGCNLKISRDLHVKWCNF